MASPIELLYDALRSDLGIIVETNEPKILRAKMYAARKEADDPELDCLSLLESPTNPDQDLWILKRPTGETDGK